MRFNRVAAAVALVAGTSLVPATAEATVAVVSFRVVTPEGLPVRNAVVVVSVLGPTYSQIRVLSGTPAGDVVVPLPADDPVAAARLAADDPVNVLIRVFDREPGSPGVNATYVTASFGVDAFGVFGELSSVTGETFSLLPGRTAFVPVPADAPVTVAASADGCDPSPDNAPYICYLRDFPDWSLHTAVPVAYNHGASPDMTSTLRYNSTKVTQTSIAVQAGGGGFVQGDGTVAYENVTSSGFGFADHGEGEFSTAYLDTAFMRERSGMCYADGGDGGEWVCQLETVYRPYEANGTYSDAWYGGNGAVDRTFDCWVPVDQYYEPETKSNTRTSFALRLGPSETWAEGSQGGLYANTTITQQTHTGQGFLRRWDVTSRSFRHHYIYVVQGMVGLDPTSAVRATCVRTRLGDALTSATDEDFRAVRVDDTRQPPEDTSQVEAAPHHQVCGRMPDRCD